MNIILKPLVKTITKWFPLIIVGIGVSVGPLDTSVNIAFPEISEHFQIPITGIQWVIISFVLTNATLQLGFGRIGDMIGHKKVFITGLIWSGFSFLLCGYAPTFTFFLLARCLQGIGAALILSCAPALATLNFPENERGKVLGGFFMFISIALALGPMIGGQMVAHWGWQFVFFFRIPIACLATVLALFYLKQPIIEKKNQSFDWQGWLSLVSFVGISFFILTQGSQVGWLSIKYFVLVSVASLCFLYFVRHELHVRDPIIDLRYFGNVGFSLSNLAFIFTIASSFFIFLLVPYYLITYLKIPASTGGLLLAMAPIGTMISSLLGGQLLTRFSAQSLRLIGISFSTVGLLGISFFQVDTTFITIIGLLIIHGLGIGLFQVAQMDYVMAFIPLNQRGVAGSLTLSINTIGIFSGAMIGTFAFNHFKSSFSTDLLNQAARSSGLEMTIFISAFKDTLLIGTLTAFLSFIILWISQIKRDKRNC